MYSEIVAKPSLHRTLLHMASVLTDTTAHEQFVFTRGEKVPFHLLFKNILAKTQLFRKVIF